MNVAWREDPSHRAIWECLITYQIDTIGTLTMNQKQINRNEGSMKHSDDHKRGLKLSYGARIWGCSYSQFRELIRQGVIESYPLGPGSQHRRVTIEGIEHARRKLQSMLDNSVAIGHKKSDLSNVPGDEFFNSVFR